MQAHIFTEGSSTKAHDHDQPIKEYYEGIFNVTANLYEEFTKCTDVHLHITSEKFGVRKGEETVSDIHESAQIPVGSDEMVEMVKAEILDAAATADVIVILLSTDVFQKTVCDVWDELVGEAKPGSVWCLGAAQSSLETLDFEELETKECTILTYQRVGVAPIDTETRGSLFEAVKQKSAK